MEILNILTDLNTGLTVNCRMVRDGKHVRMVEIYIVTPKGDRIALNQDGVSIISDDYNNTFGWWTAINVQRPDVMILSEQTHKNDNVNIYVSGDEGYGATEFLIIRKRISKHSMKFSIEESRGLSHNLTGVVGQSIIPHDYHVDKKNGTVTVQDRVIDSNDVFYSDEDRCYKITQHGAEKFMGHQQRDFILKTPFSKLIPGWINQAQLHEDSNPK